MKTYKYVPLCCTLICLLILTAFTYSAVGGWISLFDGKSLKDWKVGDNAETFSVRDSMIVVHGKTAHLFYDGPVMNHNFRNFEFKADVMTHQGTNSGIYIHTAFQQGGWPAKGYEIQVNNTHTDWRRTGSVYGVDDIREVYVKDSVWFNMDITVQGKRIVVKLNNQVVKDFTEPTNLPRTGADSLRRLSSGTFALQGHDPNSLTFFKNIMVRPLP